jgi:putative ABC transport system ATP-binding protein
MTNVIDVQGGSRTYVDGDLRVEALRDISVAIEERCFAMVVGASGCGKTTLLNILGCVDVLDSGTLTIAGRSVERLHDRELTRIRAQQVGFIFQNFSLIPVLSAFENVEYGLVQADLPAGERSKRVERVLRDVGLADFARHRPNQLSGGQRQRVAIARALVKDPAIVLADEPTANLDSATGASIIALMRQMQKDYRTTFVFSTHDPALMRYADRTLSMRDGRIVDDQRTATGTAP